VLSGRVRQRDVLLLVGASLASLAATYVAVRVGTGFDAWRRLSDILDYTRGFYRDAERPYAPWLAGNLKETALAVGPTITTSIIAAFCQMGAEHQHGAQREHGAGFQEGGAECSTLFRDGDLTMW